ncbi:hypothetical protein C8J56DRAFT_757228, partial [Mycena floridula]
GRQKYDRHHLCKHLVQAVPAPPTKFWQQITRRRVLPLYRHPNLHSKGDAAPQQGYVEAEDGSITEGDDYVWSGNRELM